MGRLSFSALWLACNAAAIVVIGLFPLVGWVFAAPLTLAVLAITHARCEQIGITTRLAWLMLAPVVNLALAVLLVLAPADLLRRESLRPR